MRGVPLALTLERSKGSVLIGLRAAGVATLSPMGLIAHNNERRHFVTVRHPTSEIVRESGRPRCVTSHNPAGSASLRGGPLFFRIR